MKKPASISSSMMETATSSAALIVLNLVSGVLLARVLGPDGRGDYGKFLFWSQITILLSHLSLFEAFIIKSRGSGGDPITDLPLLMLLGLGISILCTAVFGTATVFGFITISELSLASTIALFAIFTLVGFFNLAVGGVERARLAFRRLNLERVVTPALFMVFMIVLYWNNVETVGSLLLAFAAAKLMTLGYRASRFRRHFFGPIDRSMARQMISLGPSLHVATGLLILAGQADRLFVVLLWSSERIGFYLVAYSAVGAGMSLASQAIQVTLLPHLAGLVDHIRRQVVERMIRGSLLFGAAVAVPIWIVAPWLIPAIYGPQFAPAAHYVQWITVAMAVTPCMWAVNVANRAIERSRPGIEMGLVSIAIFASGYALTGFDEPKWLFLTMFLANLLAIARGLLALTERGVVRIGLPLVPGPADVRYIVRAILSLLRRQR